MKKRRNIIAALTLFTALSLTACAGNSTGESNNTQQSSASVTEADESTDDLQAQLTALYEQEQKIFDGHKDTWDKVFEVMDKVESDSDYADFLLSAVEYNKSNLSSEELDMLTKDIEAIRDIEKDINDIAEKLLSNDSYVSSDDSDAFKHISGTDLDGNEIDQSLISDSTVTVLNFWFSGCKPCVAELSKLNELNETISSKGGQVIGVNVNTFDGNDSAIEEAKGILESQGAKYRNICFASDSDAGKYALGIMAFPTTILVDRNGNIVGQPLLGGIDNEENFNKLMEQIQSVMDADNAD